jgi:hypothetical protein
MPRWSKGSPLFAALRTEQQRSDFAGLEVAEGLALTALRDGQASEADTLLLQNMAALSVVVNPGRHALAHRVYQEPTYREAATLWRLTCADRRSMPVARFEAVLARLDAQRPPQNCADGPDQLTHHKNKVL